MQTTPFLYIYALTDSEHSLKVGYIARTPNSILYFNAAQLKTFGSKLKFYGYKLEKLASATNLKVGFIARTLETV